MKTTVRAHVIIPDCYLTIQRLYDDGKFFRLEKETKTGEDAAEFIERLIAQSGRLLDAHEFVDDDDFKTKLSATFEYISD
jgi:hypothetical protein